jgi:hypothetical protein
MDADIQGCLDRLSWSYKAFEHNGSRMTKVQVKKVLEYGVSKGYKLVSEISDFEVNQVLSKI